MAAELCVPGCLLCQFRPCPACRGDALCASCWTDLQDLLWFEEWEADGGVVEEDEMGDVADGAGLADFVGTPTTCPFTDESDHLIEGGESPDP